jgi:uncharacterized cupredoxin-like copper-binding protein
VLLAGLSTAHMIGLAVVAAIFISFALISSFVASRFRPDFPGRAGLSVFVIACFVLFGAMVTAVVVFGAEGEATAGETQAGAVAAQTVQVQEKEFTIVLSSATKLTAGPTTFVVRNVGTVQHDLAIQGPNLKTRKTKLISPGGKATLTVTLAKGTYTVWCTVPGHRELGMQGTLRVR